MPEGTGTAAASGPAVPGGSRPSTLKRRLMVLVAAAVLPLACFAVASIVLLANSKQEDFERSLADTVRALSTAVDNELLRSASVVEALALTSDQVEPLRALANDVLERQPGWLSVVLSTPEGEYVFDASRPLGRELPQFVRDREGMVAAAGRGGATVGDLFVGQLPRQAVFTASAPVFGRGQVRYVLTAAISPDSLLSVLQRQRVPPDATIAVLDSSRTVVARSRQHHSLVGSPATPDLQAMMRGRGEGFGYPRTLEGIETFAAFCTSTRTGWSVVIGMPKSSVLAPLRGASISLAIGLALSLLLAGIATAVLLRSILGPINALHASARSIVEGKVAPVADTPLSELRAVSEALAQASQSLRESRNLREMVLQQEQQARRSAEQASREKDQFIAILSHELRNPLAVIGNASELLQRSNLPHRSSQWTDSIRRQVRHLSYLINDLLDVSRAAAGKMSVRRQPLDLADCVTDAARLLRDGGLPSAHEVELDLQPAPVIGDHDRLQQVAVNLIGNAMKYSPAGTLIRVTVRQREQGSILEVRDQGIGMDTETLTHVFDLFFQKERSSTNPQNGLGVGLTLVRKIVELHGGCITASSPGPGRGSTFTVWLPRPETEPQASDNS